MSLNAPTPAFTHSQIIIPGALHRTCRTAQSSFYLSAGCVWLSIVGCEVSPDKSVGRLSLLLLLVAAEASIACLALICRSLMSFMVASCSCMRSLNFLGSRRGASCSRGTRPFIIGLVRALSIICRISSSFFGSFSIVSQLVNSWSARSLFPRSSIILLGSFTAAIGFCIASSRLPPLPDGTTLSTADADGSAASCVSNSGEVLATLMASRMSLSLTPASARRSSGLSSLPWCLRLSSAGSRPVFLASCSRRDDTVSPLRRILRPLHATRTLTTFSASATTLQMTAHSAPTSAVQPITSFILQTHKD
mmetsp:Transcript_40096/g.100357  ORF Transcript_40096/g.100357 Transcript_40096/m.100357 type:complete len:307 (-) Transcript_40096:114-1034(-)